jgi:hypothetical protein
VTSLWHEQRDGRWFKPEVCLPAQLMHCQTDDSPIVAFCFLAPIDPSADAEARKRITSFLLAEQCRERRKRHSHP